MVSLSVAILTVFVCQSVVGVIIDCEYSDYSWTTYGPYYTCIVQNNNLITSSDDREIRGVRGEHMSGRNNSDVQMILSMQNKVFYFPRGITRIFKNIHTVDIQSAGLKEITRDDLKEYGTKLKRLWLAYNLIQVIESDLFHHNPDLEYFSLWGGKLRHMEEGSVTGLKELYSFGAGGGSPCENYDTIKETEDKCKDTNYMIGTYIPSLIRKGICSILNEVIFYMTKNNQNKLNPCQASMSHEKEYEDFLKTFSMQSTPWMPATKPEALAILKKK